MIRLAALIGSVLALALTVPPSRAQAVDGAAMDEFVRKYAHDNGSPGLAAVVVKDGKLERMTVYGRDSAGAPVSADTPFPVASLSKSFTALAVMQLVDAGKVELDAPVRTYLPEFQMADPRAASITLRQLLTHTSGLSDKAFPEKSLPQPHSLREAVARLAHVRLESAPGRQFHYHNPNFAVVARLVEVVSGEPFTDYMKRHVFEPAGMTSTYTVGDLKEAPNVARGHIRLFGLPVPAAEPGWYLEGFGGVVTTPRDMAQWLILQTNDGVSAAGARVVSHAAIEQMHAAGGAAWAHGLGWDRSREQGKTRIAHGGWLFTYQASELLLPESRTGIAAMSNVGLSLAADDADQVASGLAELAEGGKPKVGPPMGIIAGSILAAICLLTIGLGWLGLARARAWTQRRERWPVWVRALACLPTLAPVVLLASLKPAISFVFGGRDGSWIQIVYLAGPLVLWLAVGSVFGLAICIARLKPDVKTRTLSATD